MKFGPYHAVGYCTDHYDKRDEVRVCRSDVWDIWKWAVEFLSAPNRKVVVYREEPKKRKWKGSKLKKIWQGTEADAVPTWGGPLKVK